MPFLIDWIVNGDRDGHIQSLLLGAVLFIVSIQLFALGIIGDLLAGQRVMTKRVYERVRRIELELEVEPSHRLDPLVTEAPSSNRLGDSRRKPNLRPVPTAGPSGCSRSGSASPASSPTPTSDRFP